MNFEARKRIMREIVKAAFDGCVKIGFSCSVDYGEDSGDACKPTQDWAVIEPLLFACDEEILRVYSMDGGRGIGWVRLIYCNEPGEVICDYTVNLEDALAKANEAAEGWS